MRAADIPDCETHRTSLAMARALVTYLDDSTVIRQAIKREFDHVPTERTIRDLRARHLARLAKPEEAPFKPHDGYYPRDAADSLAKTNALFLLRLQDERTLSLALRDRFKRVPELVE